jgi:hypothetical protein
MANEFGVTAFTLLHQICVNPGNRSRITEENEASEAGRSWDFRGSNFFARAVASRKPFGFAIFARFCELPLGVRVDSGGEVVKFPHPATPPARKNSFEFL